MEKLNIILITVVLAVNSFAAAYDSSESDELRSPNCRPVLRPCACVTVNPCEMDPSVSKPNLLTAEDVRKNIRGHLPKELDLSGLGIEGLDTNAFVNCTEITSLNLSDNEISDLPALVFMNLTNLEHLSLAGNKIKGTKNAFVGLTKLKTLDLSGNPLSKILDDSCFFGLTNSCDITIRGVSGIKLIGTNAFANGYPIPFGEDTIKNDNNNDEREPKSVHIRSAPIDWGDEENSNENFHSQVCIEGDSVQRLEISPEIRGSGCEQVSTKWKTYDLSGMLISKFEKGWYRLKDKNLVPSSLSAINLSRNNIVNVTSNIMNELSEFITWMDLSDNKIGRLEGGCFEHGRIFSLQLSNNLIAEIEDNAFKMPALYQLYLNGNRLKDTKFASTLPLSLVSLDLDYNEITEISAHSFSNLKKLSYLSLDNNRLTVLPNQCLLGATSINQLSFSNNQITTVESGAFENINPFQIFLDGNNISSIEKGTFTGITRLEQLNMERNKLTEIAPEMFDQPHLRLLQLGDNNIMSIKKGAVKNLIRLETLEISKNPIKRLENGALFGLNKTRKVYVDVTATPIEVIQGGLFDDV